MLSVDSVCSNVTQLSAVELVLPDGPSKVEGGGTEIRYTPCMQQAINQSHVQLQCMHVSTV